MQTTPQLPTSLKREPLIDALFEIRFEPTALLSDTLPGMLLSDLNPRPNITRLPTAEVPQPIRASDPNLRFVPTHRLDLGSYIISIGDSSLILSCKLPYPKWHNFKIKIFELLSTITKLNISPRAIRYSLKYVNLIEAKTLEEQLDKIELSVKLGPICVSDQQLNVQIHHKDDNIIHILTIVNGAAVRLLDGNIRSGIIVDIDSIRNIEPTTMSTFSEMLNSELETLRQSNKTNFFNCLKKSTILEMEPSYE